MSGETATQSKPGGLGELIGGKELLQMVVQRLSSQLLLFSIAVIVFVLTAFFLFQEGGLVISLLIIFVFLTAMVGYLFVEEKRKVVQEDPQTVSRLLGNQVAHITKPASASADFNVELDVQRVEAEKGGSRDIAIRPTGTTSAFHIGDRINIRFRASRDCYLTLLNVGTSGKLTVLFPNAVHPDHHIRGGEIHEIPGSSYGFEYVLQGPSGTERLKAVATLDRVRLLESHFAPDGALFRNVESTAAARDIAVVKQKTETLPEYAWAEAHVEFQVLS